MINNANNVSLTDTGDLNFGASTISGNLIARTTGAITQTGLLTVSGTSGFRTNASPISLTQNNLFGGAVSLTNTSNLLLQGTTDVSVTNNGLLTLGQSSLGNGALTLTGIGVTQTGAITQASNADAVTINAGAGAINLNNSGNALSGAVSLNNTGVNDVALTNSIALAMGTSNVGAGTLSLTAGGTISETGAITQAANAGTVTLSVTTPLSDILLASQPNDFSGAIVYGGTLSNIRDLGRRNIHINAGITSTNIDLLTNLRNLTLILDNASVYAPSFTLHDGGNLYVDTSGSLSGGTGGNISQIGPAIIPGTATLIAGNHAISVNQNNTIGGEVSISNSGNNNVSITNTSELQLSSANVGSGTLTLTGLGVTQSGAITQEANAGDILINAGAGVITLPSGNNIFTGAVSINNSGTNNIELTNSLPLVLGASSIGSGTIALTSGGTLSETGPLIQAANAGAVTITLTAPSSDLLFGTQPNDTNSGIFFGGTLSNIRDISRRNVSSTPGVTGTNPALLTNLRNLTIILDNAGFTAPAFTLHAGGSLMVDTSGSLSGGVGGNISQIGAITVPGTVSLNAGAHAISLTQNNLITGDVTLSNSGNNNVSITNAGLLSLGTSSVGSGTLTLTGVGVTQTGAITQATSAGAATINAGAGPITLTNSGNTFTGSVSLINSGANNIALQNSGSLTLGTSTVGTGTLSLTSGGAITQTGILTQPTLAGVITLASTIADSDFDLSTAANNISGNITFGGTLANIRDFKLRNLNSNALFPTNITSLTNLRNLTFNFDNAGINFSALTLHNGGSLSATAGGAITETGALVVPGTSSFNAGSHPITLTQNNIFTGDVSLSNTGANNIEVTNTGLLSLGLSNVGSGELRLTGVGVSQTGAITQEANAGNVTINAGAGIIGLTQNNLLTGTVVLTNTGANNIGLTNSIALNFGTSNIGSGAFDITAGGTVSQTGPVSQEANAGISTYSFTTPNSDLLLNQANNTNGFINIGGTLSNLRDVELRNIGTANQAVVNLQLLTNLRNLKIVLDNIGISLPALTLHSGGNLILDTSGALSGGTGGSISQTGVFTIPGTSSFSAGSHEISLTQNNVLTGSVTLSNTGANNVALTNSVALNLAASSVGSGSLNLTGVGISQTGNIIQTGNANLTSINAGAGPIDLSNTANLFSGDVSLNNSGANNIALTTAGGLTLAASNIGSGTLALTASGDINQTGGITQTDGAGGISIKENVGGSDILLDQANNLTGPITFIGTLGNIDDFSLRNTNINAVLPTNLTSLPNLRNLTLQFNNRNLVLPTLSLSGGGNLSVIAGGAITQTGILNVPGSSSFNAGANPITLTQNNVMTGPVALTNTGENDVNLIVNGALKLAASTIGRSLTAVASSDITLTGAIHAGDSIVLSGSRFINNAGALTLNPGTGNYLVWSVNPANDTRGGLVYDFKQYNAIYGTTPVQGTGSGFLYSIAPSITPDLTGTVSKSYTGTDAATLTQSNYTYSGNIDGDVITFSPTTGTYDSVNVGTNINVTVTGITIVSAVDGSAIVYGYQLSPTTASANIGTITPAELTITPNDINKTYGQTVTFNGSEFTSTGLQNGETVGSVSLTSSGAIDTASVAGGPYSIDSSDATGGTFDPANYTITYANGTLTVDPAGLTYTANQAVRLVGQTNPAFSGTVTGFVLGQTQATATTGTLSFTSTANEMSRVGQYPIYGSGLSANDGNYFFRQAESNINALTINAAPIPNPVINVNKSLIVSVTTPYVGGNNITLPTRVVEPISITVLDSKTTGKTDHVVILKTTQTKIPFKTELSLIPSEPESNIGNIDINLRVMNLPWGWPMNKIGLGSKEQLESLAAFKQP